jgi:mannosyltransferase
VCVATGGAVVGRYTAVVVPLVLLLVAFGIRTLPPAPSLGVLSTVVVLGLLASLTIATTPHTQAGRIAEVLNADAKTGDLIVYCPDQLAPGVESLLTVTGVDRLTLPPQQNPAVVDWTSYEARIAALKPKVLADGIADYVRATPDATVWFVSGVGYRTHTQVCPALHNRLIGALGFPGQVLSREGRGGEKASLERFPR